MCQRRRTGTEGLDFLFRSAAACLAPGSMSSSSDVFKHEPLRLITQKLMRLSAGVRNGGPLRARKLQTDVTNNRLAPVNNRMSLIFVFRQQGHGA